ncbi:hypothetical protein P4050_00460 [Pseudomonas aeruginosa]|nr:hypothetical protein [Pseudomonas aeruginosa]
MELSATPMPGGIVHTYEQGSVTDSPLAVTSDSTGMCIGTSPGRRSRRAACAHRITRRRQAATDLGATWAPGAADLRIGDHRG